MTTITRSGLKVFNPKEKCSSREMRSELTHEIPRAAARKAIFIARQFSTPPNLSYLHVQAISISERSPDLKRRYLTNKKAALN